ncbi:hypothetical protein [Silvibacterium dinghuense]|uniref:Uncharacterized protein n=1 Tax=Silvibacterium dinghuense TaxID=1560006 RepID=A0A4Q1SJI7_9BACT|nr:hypothetical protein [Silvibacterium dinghuense]RXS97440.1 hypothetical protein ESZ00_05960 [Silvibacterium dinghuense]GGG99025.1 hypothetical protein GCM10011586_13150 [Silvibacterium dinghuense]
MAAPYRSTCTIDGQQFDCLSVSVAFSTEKDRAGMPQMGSLSTTIRAYVDFHDDQNMPYSTMSNLFNLANVVTRDKVKSIKLEFWKDDSHQDALASYTFNGWISGFHTLNPYQSEDQLSSTDHSGINHVLVLDLEPAMNQQNFSDISLSN